MTDDGPYVAFTDLVAQDVDLLDVARDAASRAFNPVSRFHVVAVRPRPYRDPRL